VRTSELRLIGRRPEQLRLLRDAAAVSRETAVAPIARGDLRPVTLSRLVGEGFAENAYLPFNGDSKRRLSHYWLNAKGQRAAADL
jgi:hypothetical protein